MNQQKKDRERCSLDVVVRALDLPPTSIVESESPDFLLEMDSRRIGVEVTELYLPSGTETTPPEQAFENDERRIIERARIMATERGVPSQLMNVRLSRHSLCKPNKQLLATTLCDFVAANAAPPGQTNHPHDLPPGVVYLTLYGHRSEPHSWHGPCSGWPNAQYTSGFQAAIDKKEVRRQKYLTRCDEVWLILAATWEGGSSFIKWSEAMEQQTFTSRFDRVFFVEGLSGKSHELRIAQPSLTPSPNSGTHT